MAGADPARRRVAAPRRARPSWPRRWARATRASSAARCATRCSGIDVADVDLATPLRPEDVERPHRAPPGSRRCRPGSRTARSPRCCRRARSRSRRCAATSRPTAGTRPSRSPTTGARMPRGAISRSTRSTPIRRPARSSTISAGSTICAARRVRFIGDPLQRIAEDHLRILRFFRFLARFGDAPDAGGLAACAARANDLMALSRERIARRIAEAAGRAATRSRRSR